MGPLRPLFNLGLLLLLSTLTACAAARRESAVPPRLEAAALVTGSVFVAEDGEFFRHKVKISTPILSAPLSFDGIMHSVEGGDPTGKRVHVAGLGGMGLRLFSMVVTKDGFYPEYLHPSLARVAHVEEYIALCVRSIWIEGQYAGKGWSVRRSGKVEPAQPPGPPADGARIPQSPESARQAQSSGEASRPEIFLFTHTKPEFTVEIRLLEYSGPCKDTP